MLRVASALMGYAVMASDGAIGTVRDLLFDDRTWKLSWLVVDTGGWLTGRKVLVHPSAVGSPDDTQRQVPVALTRALVKASPDILSDAPVSLQMEEGIRNYFGWSPYWDGNDFGIGAMGSSLMPAPDSRTPDPGAVVQQESPRTGARLDDGDPHLRSIAAVKGYHIHASDGSIGHVEDFVIDDAAWDIRYLIIDTANWWPGEHVLMSPLAVQKVSWGHSQIRLNVSRAKVKAGPAWKPFDAIDPAFEARLRSHYFWPGLGH
jgi:sporulation protein YlmC with PRC-barrel domain